MTERLAQLLFSATSREVAPKIPAVRKFLYNQDGPLPPSVLDGLMQNQWRQRPMAEAPNDLAPSKKHVVSNVLQFPCRNAFITRTDFKSLLPPHRDRTYEIPQGSIDFHMVKSRNPVTLRFQDAYYLVFRSHVDACVYLNETQHKHVNGIGLNLRFVKMDKNRLKHVYSPYISGSAIPDNNVLYEHVPVEELFAKSQEKLDQIKLLAQSDSSVDFDLMGRYIDYNSRSTAVVVRNLPLRLTDRSLGQLLWDYDLRRDPFTTVINDVVRQAHVKVIRFKNTASAERFVRNFHGRPWDYGKEGKVYERVVCEVLI